MHCVPLVEGEIRVFMYEADAASLQARPMENVVMQALLRN